MSKLGQVDLTERVVPYAASTAGAPAAAAAESGKGS